MAAYCETFSGIRINLERPSCWEIEIADISRGLSHCCRWGGQIEHFYSVAEHCCFCLQLARRYNENPHTQLYTLLHDASEAYICDIPAPLKKALPDYSFFEEQLMNTVCLRFGIDQAQVDFARVKYYDQQMAFIEASHLLRSKGSWWIGDIHEEIDFSIGRSFDQSRREFEDSFLEVSRYVGSAEQTRVL